MITATRKEFYKALAWIFVMKAHGNSLQQITDKLEEEKLISFEDIDREEIFKDLIEVETKMVIERLRGICDSVEIQDGYGLACITALREIEAFIGELEEGLIK